MALKKSTTSRSVAGITLTAQSFLKDLTAAASKANIPQVQRFFRDSADKHNKCLGVRWGIVFRLSKMYADMSLPEVKKLLDSDYYEARMGAVSIMDFKARDKKITEKEKKAVFELYIHHHDRINNWDLVDRSAPFVVGGYLYNKPRSILYKMARSTDPWQRRTAIVSTYYFIRKGETLETFKIARLLLKEQHDLVQKAVGSWIREAGKKDIDALIIFLDRHASKMPRAMLRLAIEKLDKKKREYYLSLDTHSKQ